MNSLRFINDPARNGALNMAIDDLLACRAVESKVSVVFRLYRWSKPTLSCGFHQRIEKRVDFESCWRNKVNLVRRPTGGRELLHDGDLSFSIIGALDYQKPEKFAAKDFFFKAGRVIIEGLEALGIKASLADGLKKAVNSHHQPCLAAPSQYEVVCGGKKIAPMAQRVYPDSVLVHGSIPLADSEISTVDLLKVENKLLIQRKIAESSTNLCQIIGKTVNFKALEKRFLISFENVFSGKAELINISKREMAEAFKEKFSWQINNEFTSKHREVM
ncbi:MAG: hypothetical protein J7K40_14165 [candidate division Zixibacteria bacterium]|nr:hypothetical protein [candidate division Zixibacteria bacterium]